MLRHDAASVAVARSASETERAPVDVFEAAGFAHQPPRSAHRQEFLAVERAVVLDLGIALGTAFAAGTIVAIFVPLDFGEAFFAAQLVPMRREELLRFGARWCTVEVMRVPVDVLEVFDSTDLGPDVAHELGLIAGERPRGSVTALSKRPRSANHCHKDCDRESHFRLPLMPTLN